MIGTSFGAVYEGIEGTTVQVEADVSNGLPQFSIVGLPDSAVSESKLRIRSAIRNAGMEFPNRRITVNLSPASLKKRGSGLDLAIAIAILRASGQVPEDGQNPIGFAAELSLSGHLGAVPGLVTLALALQRQGLRSITMANSQLKQCVPIPQVTWIPFPSLLDVVQFLRNPSATSPAQFHSPQAEYPSPVHPDFTEVSGLEDVKRALTISAAGHHHIVLVGPPGCGKTMLGERFASILPRLSELDALEVYAIHQACDDTSVPSQVPPTRMPHHTVSVAGMVGGGHRPIPGEVTLAHRGVLFLDEVLEFQRPALDALREPIVQKRIRLSRSGYAVTLPAHFLLIGTLNPCPCGQQGFGECTCVESSIHRYWGRLSGALMDRIDMFVQVQPQRFELHHHDVRSSADIRQQVSQARMRLTQVKSASEQKSLVTQPSNFQDSAWKLFRQAVQHLRLSGRATSSITAMANTIAALDEREHVTEADISEAIALRAAPMSTRP
jgi:magnesium chelatase family protein